MDHRATKTCWHCLVGETLKILLDPVGIEVRLEVPVVSLSPKADLILIQRKGGGWTNDQRLLLADGLRDLDADQILAELKITESLNEDALSQITVYDTLYLETARLARSAGFALLWIVLIFIFMGVVGGGLGVLANKGNVTSEKTIDGNKSVTSAVDAVIGFVVANKRLPTLLSAAVSDTRDSWGQNLNYLYDSVSSAPTTTTICSLTSTEITIGGTIGVAFAILSGGDNANIQTTKAPAGASWSGPTTGATVVTVGTMGIASDGYSGADDPAGAAARLEPYDDIVQWVTLDELKAKVGCEATDPQGKLTIINNSLPKTKESTGYAASVYATGGTPFAPDLYNWCYSYSGVSKNALLR